MALSLDNTKSCNALNNIFIEELKFKCKEDADSLIEEHKKAFENNEDYYCNKYDNTFVGKKWTSGNGISFPKNRTYCVEGIEESTCDELKELVGKKLEDEIIAYGYYISEEGERLKKYESKCSILYMD